MARLAISAVLAGAVFLGGLMVLITRSSDDESVTARVATGLVAAVVLAALLFLSLYFSVVRHRQPDLRLAEPASRKISWRERIWGDGRPQSTAVRVLNYVRAAFFLLVGGLYLALGLPEALAWWEVVLVVSFVVLSVQCFVSAHRGRHARPPYRECESRSVARGRGQGGW